MDTKDELTAAMEQLAEQIKEQKKVADQFNKEETELKSSRIEVRIITRHFSTVRAI